MKHASESLTFERDIITCAGICDVWIECSVSMDVIIGHRVQHESRCCFVLEGVRSSHLGCSARMAAFGRRLERS